MNWNIQVLKNNVNTGIEYEYALYYSLLNGQDKSAFKTRVINNHPYKRKIERIAAKTDVSTIMAELERRHLVMERCTIETQNDEIGPADMVMFLRSSATHEETIIGISVKYHNACTMNVTGRAFLGERDIEELKRQQIVYTQRYIDNMRVQRGNAKNWFRKRLPSADTDEYIDLLRGHVIANWQNISNKSLLLADLFHMTSPIDYWVYEYRNKGTHILHINPPSITLSQADTIRIARYETSFLAFYLEDRMIAKMQVKFNNGILEKCKKKTPDFVVDDIPMSLGKPFSSWNFSVVYSPDAER